MRKIKLKNLFLAVLLLAGLSLPVVIFAQSSSTVKTKMGNPVTSPGGDEVLNWGHQISNALEAGYDDSYDKMVASISNGSYTAPQSPGTSIGNKYWCTYLVIDSFNLAGFSGLTRAHAGVVYMLSFWKSSSEYLFLDYYNTSHEYVLTQVKPGYSILFQDNPGLTTIGDFDHAALVETISINDNGDGVLVTLDSNLPTKWGKRVNYPISNWEILGTLKGVGHPNYSIMGFGTKK